MPANGRWDLIRRLKFNKYFPKNAALREKSSVIVRTDPPAISVMYRYHNITFCLSVTKITRNRWKINIFTRHKNNYLLRVFYTTVNTEIGLDDANCINRFSTTILGRRSYSPVYKISLG